MSASQRRKGQVGERDAFAFLRDRLGSVVKKRNLAQSRDGGHDLRIGELAVVEVKRRHALSVYPWVEQAKQAATGDELAVVLARGDGKRWLAIMDGDDFSKLLEKVLPSH